MSSNFKFISKCHHLCAGKGSREANRFMVAILVLTVSWLVNPTGSQIIAASIQPQTYTINTISSYSFVLYRNNNPISSDFISPVSTVASTAYIQLIFPSAYLPVSNTPTPSCSNAQTGATLSCSVNQETNVLTINGYFSNNSTRTAQVLNITINSIVNPIRAELCGNFEYNIKTSTGTIIDQSPSATGTYSTGITFTPATFASCGISANSAYISTRSKLSFTFTSTNAIPSNGQLILDIPLTWNGDMQQLNTVASTPTCTAVSGLSTGSFSCLHSILNSPLNLARITISSLSSTNVAAGTIFSLDVASILTPPYVNSVDIISMYSQWQDGVKIDTCASPVKNTTPIPFKSVIFSVYSGTSTVQSKFTGKLQLTLSRPFYYQDEIQLQLPNNYLTNNQIVITSSNFPSFTITPDVITAGSSTTNVLLSNFPAAPSILPANNVFTLFLKDIYNFQSTQTQTITVTLYRYSQKYQALSTTYASTIGTFTSFAIASNSAAVSYVGESTISVNSQYKVSTGGTVEIWYNSAVSALDVANTSIAYAALNGVRINGVSYRTVQNVIYIANLFQSTFASGTIQIKVPTFVNPPTVKPTPYTVICKSLSGFSISSAVYNYQAALQAFRSGSATLTSDSYQVMQTNVFYTLAFQTYYGFKSVSIVVPPEVSTTSGFQTTCSPNTYTSCVLSNNNSTGFKNLTFIGTSLAGSQTLSWGNNINPNSFKPTSSFEVYTYMDGWGVEKSTGYITLTMSIQAKIVSGQVVPSSYTNSAYGNVEINYVLPALSPSGIVAVTMPTETDLLGASCGGTGIGTCTIIPPKINIVFTNTDTTTIHACSLVVTNIRNSPSYRPIGNIGIVLTTTDSYKSVSSVLTTWTNTISSTFTTQVSSNLEYKGENATFTFSISGLDGKQTYVNIKINNNFGKITSTNGYLPTGAIYVSDYQIRFNILGDITVDKSFVLQTPIFTGEYTFSLLTYTGDQYLMGKSTSNIWRHSCYGTQCKDCNGTACRSCYNSTLTQYYIYNTANNSCIRECVQGYYLQTPSNNCIPCDSNCLQCTGSAITCTKCNSTPVKYYLNTIYSKCVIICDITYYANGANQLCTACVPPCYSCSDQYTCLTCESSFYLLNTTRSCESSCPNGTMVKNQVNRTCDYCTSICLTCSIYTYNCTSCNNTVFLYLQGNTCVTNCSTQKFLKNNICTQCQMPCRVCYNSTTTCSSCFPNSTLSLWYNYKCISQSECAIGHYINYVNGSCDSCPVQCDQCVSLVSCSVCADGFFLYSNTCIPTCPNITYNDTSTKACLPCLNCVTCSSINTCTSCKNIEYLYLGVCYGTCPNGLYPNTQVLSNGTSRGICTACNITCSTCINATYCTICISQKYLYKGVCYGTCPTKTYPNVTRCVDCPTTCQTCTSPTNCLTCVTGYSLQNSQCVLSCAKGISYNQVCYPCGLNCDLCNDITCMRCLSGFYLINAVCVSQCPSSTLSIDGMTCVNCSNKFVNCTTCNSTHCLSCSDGQLTNGQCLPCVPGYYTRNSKCVVCPAPCAVCTDPTHCSSCSPGYYEQANYCVAVCPNNKIPNGTKCDVCIANCAQCNLVTSLCNICNAGLFMYQGYCVTVCPDPLVVNLNFTLCITKQDFAIQYSKASKPLYFPFTIAAFIAIGIGIALNCYIKSMHLVTFLVAVIAWVELICWIIFGIIQYIFYSNLQFKAANGVILVLISLGFLVLCNLIFVRLFYKYFVDDIDYTKWVRRHGCINIVFLILGATLSFKIHRLIYSKVLERDQLSLVLSSSKKLIPISVLTFGSILVSSSPVIVGCALALYNSISIDQQFYNALDTLIVTGIMIFLMLLDLKHKYNYFIDELETQNIKNKMYHEDQQQFNIGNDAKYVVDEFQKGSNISRQNLIDAANLPSQNMDQLQTAKKFNTQGTKGVKIEEVGENGMNQTARMNKRKLMSQDAERSNKYEQSSENRLFGNKTGEKEYQQQAIEDDDVLKQPSQDFGKSTESGKPKWVQKQFDHYGYLIKYDKDNKIVRYDKNGHRVEIDENGQHHHYDQNGYQVKEDPLTGRLTKYDTTDGFIVGNDGKKYDQRGYQVRKTADQNGKQVYKYYDQHGYQIKQDPSTGKQIKYDKYGHTVQIDPVTGQHKFYNKQGYEAQIDENENIKYKNEDGKYMRFNNQTKKWEAFDPTDNFMLVKNAETGQYQKFDEHGFRVEKDQFNNIYRYDHEGNRILLGPNKQIRRFDKQGYQIKRDPITGQVRKYDKDGYELRIDPQTGLKLFYDEHGYLIEKDFYGTITRYDQQGNTVVIDPATKKHRKYNKEGLQIVDDGKGNTFLRDKRGRKVVELEDGYYQKYDEEGNKIWLDDEGYEVETDEHGNITKYDKVGDPVSDDDENEQDERKNKQNGDGQWQLDEGEGDNAVGSISKNKNKRKFKIAKQFNFQQQYSKMLQQQKPKLLFDFQEQELEDPDNLKQFHDVEPVPEYQLERQYQTLYNDEVQRQHIKRDKSEGRMKFNLEELEDVDNTPYKNLKQKIRRGKTMNKDQADLDDLLHDNMTKQPEQHQQQHEIKSVADVSISQRSFINQGVQPLTDQSRNHQEDMQSIEELDAAQRNIVVKKRARRSQANFSKGDGIKDNKSAISGKASSIAGTKSQKKYLKSNSSRIKNKSKDIINKIYDSDEQVQSLGEQEWANQGQADLFYKDNHNSNQNTNTHEKGHDQDEPSDILSDFIPQHSDQQHHPQKASQQNLMRKKYMQSIQEVEDQLFDRLKSEDFRGAVKRTEFKLSGTPNPLVQYAKTIDVKKMQEEKDRERRKNDRYKDAKSSFARR